ATACSRNCPIGQGRRLRRAGGHLSHRRRAHPQRGRRRGLPRLHRGHAHPPPPLLSRDSARVRKIWACVSRLSAGRRRPRPDGRYSNMPTTLNTYADNQVTIQTALQTAAQAALKTAQTQLQVSPPNPPPPPPGTQRDVVEKAKKDLAAKDQDIAAKRAKLAVT